MVLTFEYIVLSFESEDKILWCDNSNETSNFGIFATLGVKGSHVTGKVDALLQTTSIDYNGHLFLQPLSLAFHKAGTSVGRTLSC